MARRELSARHKAFVVEYLGTYYAAAPEGWAKYVAMVAIPVGAWLRSRAAKYPQPVPPS